MSSNTSQVSPSAIRGSKSLLDRWDTIQGHRTSFTEAQLQTDHFVSNFISEASNYKTLAAMLCAGSAYRFTRIGAMTSTAPLLAGSGGILPLFVRAGSYVPALATESGVFAGITRGLTRLEGQNPTRSFEKDWAQAAFSLGALKLFGGVAQGQNLILQHLFADTGMVIGNHAASLAGVIEKPQGDLLTQLLHAEALNLQMLSGMSLTHGLSPSLLALERSMDFQLKSQETDLRRKEQPFFLFPSMATVAANHGNFSKETTGVDPIAGLRSFMMTGGDDAGSGGAPNIPRLRELATQGSKSAMSTLVKAAETDPAARDAMQDAIATMRSRKKSKIELARLSATPIENSPTIKSLFSFLYRQNVSSRFDLIDLLADPAVWIQAQRCLDIFNDYELERILFMVRNKFSIREQLRANSLLVRKEFETFVGDFVTILATDGIAGNNKHARESLEKYEVRELAEAAKEEPQAVALLKILVKYKNEAARGALQNLDTTYLMEFALRGNSQAVSAVAYLASIGNRQAQQDITKPHMINLLTNLK
jgi:hypothetical protein